MIFQPKGPFCIHFERKLKWCSCDLKGTAHKCDPNRPQILYSLKLVQRRDCEEVQPQSLSPWTSVPAGSAQQLSSPLGRAWSSTVGVCRRDGWGTIAMPATKTYKERVAIDQCRSCGPTLMLLFFIQLFIVLQP